MPRADLLALTPDDLATLANRGLVKRAQKDLEAGQGPARLEELSDGTVEADWSDGACVRLSTTAAISEASCSCPAMTVCRHTVATVLAYRAQQPAEAGGHNTPWDPGLIPDAALEPLWRAAVWAGIRKEWAAGLVAELQRGAKPIARLISHGATLRFLVRDDPRYVQCDCAEETPCRHVPLAVWAFRTMPSSQSSGLISTEEARYHAPSGDDAERLVLALFQHGLAQLPPQYVRQWEALPAALRRQGLLWPAEIAAEFLQTRDQYAARDARFHAATAARLVAELLIRLRAARHATGAVPQRYVRGGARDQSSELSFARLAGLGCAIEVRRRSVVVAVPLQDQATGAMLVARREVVNPAEGTPRLFSDLAASTLAKSTSFASVGAGHLLIQGAKRSANGELLTSRAQLSLSPQSGEWEKLRPPALVEGVEELQAHRDAQPPALLRPRRLAEDIHVMPVARVYDFALDAASRSLSARLEDPQGQSLWLRFPFYSRGRHGFAQLAQLLASTPVKFAAGRVSDSAAGLTLEPTALVCDEGGQRRIVQPWIAAEPTGAPLPWGDGGDGDEAPLDALTAFLQAAQDALGEAALLGLENSDPLVEQRWNALAEQAGELSLVRLGEQLSRLAGELRQRRDALDWQAEAAAAQAVELAVALTFAATLRG